MSTHKHNLLEDTARTLLEFGPEVRTAMIIQSRNPGMSREQALTLAQQGASEETYLQGRRTDRNTLSDGGAGYEYDVQVSQKAYDALNAGRPSARETPILSPEQEDELRGQGGQAAVDAGGRVGYDPSVDPPAVSSRKEFGHKSEEEMRADAKKQQENILAREKGWENRKGVRKDKDGNLVSDITIPRNKSGKPKGPLPDLMDPLEALLGITRKPASGEPQSEPQTGDTKNINGVLHRWDGTKWVPVQKENYFPTSPSEFVKMLREQDGVAMRAFSDTFGNMQTAANPTQALRATHGYQQITAPNWKDEDMREKGFDPTDEADREAYETKQKDYGEKMTKFRREYDASSETLDYQDKLDRLSQQGIQDADNRYSINRQIAALKNREHARRRGLESKALGGTEDTGRITSSEFLRKEPKS